MRNPLLSKKLKRTVTRLLIIDDNQIRYNQINELLTEQEYQVQATLLDDLQTFEKQLNLNWDVIIFGRAYDLKYEQALSLLRNSSQSDVPMILLQPEDYSAAQYLNYIRKGIYDILDLNNPEIFCLGLLRALSLSRLVQSQKQLVEELEIAQNQAQLLVEDSSNAIAIIQEGIHVQANDEYLKLFGLKSEDDLIGLPILDILQPLELPTFKTRLKKAAQGQFDLGSLEITSQNAQITASNPLKIEFSPSTEEDAIQLTIDLEGSSSPTKTVAAPQESAATLYQQINRSLSQQPSNNNTLVLFSLSHCPDAIFKANWKVTKQYFEEIKTFLKEQTHVPLFRVASGMYLGLFQAESQEKLESKLISLNALKKPQLLQIEQNTYPLHLEIGYKELDGQLKDEQHLEQIITGAYEHALPSNKESHALELELVPEFSFEPVVQDSPAVNLDIPLVATEIEIAPPAVPVVETVTNDEPIIHALRQCLDKGEIHLKYQQLYDKEDTQLYTYEVTSGFIFDNKWQSITGIRELAQDQELSIKLDRWILVESCKQLHNFITQYPEARLIVNLNKEVLLYDRTFPEFISKLITIIRSKLSHPLILQFSEEDLTQYREDAKKHILQLRKHGAEIALRDFGDTLYSETFLQEFEIQSICISEKLAKKLKSEKTYPDLQEKINSFNELKPLNILVRGLDDMTSFANAWNIDARFLQGDYFQKKLDHLIDIQDQ